MKSKEQLKQEFKNLQKPDENDFSELIESYFHRDVPITLEELSMLKANLATIDKTNDGTETLGNVDTKEQVNAKINFAINALKANAPETYDTLKEIADYIANDSNAEAALLQLINTKLDIPTMLNNYYGLWDDASKKFINGSLYKATETTTLGSTTNYSKIIWAVDSTTQAALIAPRVTQAQRLAITLGATQEGAIVYQIDGVRGYYLWNGTSWQTLGSNIAIADLTNTSARIFTQNAAFTWATLGNPYYITGLINKTSDLSYNKSLIQDNTGNIAYSDRQIGFSSIVDMFFTDDIQWIKPTFNSNVYTNYNRDGDNLFQAGNTTNFGLGNQRKGVLYSSSTSTVARCNGNYMGYTNAYTNSSFSVYREFSIDTSISTQRVFVGYSDNWRVPGANPTNVTINTLTNLYGLFMDSGNPNLMFIHNTTGTPTIINTNITHNINNIYGLYVTKDNGSSNIYIKLKVFDTTTGNITYFNYTMINNYPTSGTYGVLYCIDELNISTVKVTDYGLIKQFRRLNS